MSKQGRIQDLIRGGPQIMTGLKLPFWGLSFVEFWCWGLIFGGQGGAWAPGTPPGSAPAKVLQTTVHLLGRFVFHFLHLSCSLNCIPCELNFHTNCHSYQLDGNSGLLFHNLHILLLHNKKIALKYISIKYFTYLYLYLTYEIYISFTFVTSFARIT